MLVNCATAAGCALAGGGDMALPLVNTRCPIVGCYDLEEVMDRPRGLVYSRWAGRVEGGVKEVQCCLVAQPWNVDRRDRSRLLLSSRRQGGHGLVK